MIFIPTHELDKWKSIHKKRQENFIEKAKNADPAFAIMMEMIYESSDFKDYPEEQQQVTKDFIEARNKML